MSETNKSSMESGFQPNDFMHLSSVIHVSVDDTCIRGIASDQVLFFTYNHNFIVEFSVTLALSCRYKIK